MFGFVEEELHENITKDYTKILESFSSTLEQRQYLVNEMYQSSLPMDYDIEYDKYEQIDLEDIRTDIVYNMLRKIWSEEELIINSKRKKKSNMHKKFKRKYKKR